MASPDPGYGDPLAPVGTPEWAKRWRLCFQTTVKSLPSAVDTNRCFYEQGIEHRAWTLLTDRDGRVFRDFDDFCRTAQPWGLGTDPVKFRAHIAAEVGEKAADLITVNPGQQGERSDLEGTSGHGVPKSDAAEKKAKRLRAILRAPEVVQELYKDDRLTQKDAARLGPKAPTPEQAACIAEARQELEGLDRAQPKPAFRRVAKAVVDRHLGQRAPTPLETAQRAYRKLSGEERAALRAWQDAQDG